MKTLAVIKHESGIAAAVKLVIETLKFYDFKNPVEIFSREVDEDRSTRQNRLMHRWFDDIEKAGVMSKSEARAYCKLHFGVAILKEEVPEFAEQYDRLIKGRFTYEEKLELMIEPTEYPITRIMSVKQMSRFLDKIQVEFSGKCVSLTDPALYNLEVRGNE